MRDDLADHGIDAQITRHGEKSRPMIISVPEGEYELVMLRTVAVLVRSKQISVLCAPSA